MLENSEIAKQVAAPESGIVDEPNKDGTLGAEMRKDGKSLDAIFGVKLDVRVVLGRCRIPISELLKLTKGSVIELDRRVGEPVDLMINDRMVARGDLVRVEGDMLGVALREIIKDFVTES